MTTSAQKRRTCRFDISSISSPNINQFRPEQQHFTIHHFIDHTQVDEIQLDHVTFPAYQTRSEASYTHYTTEPEPQ
jgi:hypothetical protein